MPIANFVRMGLGAGLVLVFCGFSPAPTEEKPSATVTPLLDTHTTILDQPIVYPAGTPALVKAAIVTLPPGAGTGLHFHDVPMFAYILEGEITVDYEGAGTHVYRAGDAVMEAIGTGHDGRNSGKVPVRILTVFMGADDVPDTVKPE